MNDNSSPGTSSRGDNEKSSVQPVLPFVQISQTDQRRTRQLQQQHNEDEDAESGSEPDVHSDGMPAGRQLSKLVNGKQQVDMTPPEEKLQDSRRKAEKLAANKQMDSAVREYIKCNALARIVYGSNHWRYAESFVALAEAYLDLKDYTEQARYHAENAKTILLHGGVHMTISEEERSEIYHVLIRTYYILGRAHAAAKSFSEAEQALTKAERVQQERSKLSCFQQGPPDDIDIQLAMAMARLYGKQKKHALAAAKYDECLKLVEDMDGPNSSRLIPVYQDYGFLEQSRGRHANQEKAIEHFLQAHSIAAANYPEGSGELVDTALMVAQAYANTGREEAEGSAESYLNQCLSTCTVVFGPHHAKTLEVQDEIVRLLIRTDRHQEAMTILKSSIEPKCEVFGDYSERVSDTYKLMASIHLAQGNIEKALHAYKKASELECCLGIEKIVLGTKHRKTKDTERTMELLLASPGMSTKFVMNDDDKLQNRPRFSSVVNRSNPLGGFKSPS